MYDCAPLAGPPHLPPPTSKHCMQSMYTPQQQEAGRWLMRQPPPLNAASKAGIILHVVVLCCLRGVLCRCLSEIDWEGIGEGLVKEGRLSCGAKWALQACQGSRVVKH